MATDRRAFEAWWARMFHVSREHVRSLRAPEGGYEAEGLDDAWAAWREAARRAAHSSSEERSG